MRSYLTKVKIILGAVVIMMAAPTANAGGLKVDMNNGKNIFDNGKGDVPACNSCHGATGMGNDMMGTPRLSGQIYQFLVKQLEDFATDKRQDTVMFVMNTNAKGLSSQDRKDVAAYLSTLSAASENSNLTELASSGTDVGETYRGKALVLYGDKDRDIPACQSCHGYNGRGGDPIYPVIAQQKYTYLVNQLKKWRDESRTNDPLGQMRAVAKKLTDGDINDAAAYLSGASLTTLGNTRIPAVHVPFAH